VQKFGDDWVKVTEAVGTRSMESVKAHLKYRLQKSAQLKGDAQPKDDDEPNGECARLRWTEEEKKRFIGAVRKHGKQIKLITMAVGTKTEN